MRYLDFLRELETGLKDTKVDGQTLDWWSEICLEDEIELKTGTTFPAIFIVPIPFDIIEDMRALYTAKVYLVDNITRAPNYKPGSGIVGSGDYITNRISIYNKMVTYAQAFLQQSGVEIFPEYPITIEPIVRWDNNVDGIYFNYTINTNVECL